MIPSIFLGTYFGAQLLKQIPSELLFWIIFLLVSLGFIKIVTELKGFNLQRSYTSSKITHQGPVKFWFVYAVFAGLILGIYDGFFAVGGGIIQILLFGAIFRLPLKKIITLGVLFSSISLSVATYHFYNKNLLDYDLLKIMIPATIIGGMIAGWLLDVINERTLKFFFALAVFFLLIGLLYQRFV